MASLLEIEALQVRFPSDGAVVRAVDGISYAVDEGETVAVVGESGCGKSVHALAITGLVPRPPAVIAGHIRFAGRDLAELPESELRRIRGPGIGMVFQEPMTSLNPLMTIGRQLTEHMRTHLGLSRRQATDRAVELLGLVGIGEPGARLAQYPHHFSGGMRQRVMIAMALACRPRLIVADEPTTALDVTIQAQILKLMKDLTRELGVALVVITHNLGLVARYADRVNVMYAGRIVERGTAADIFARPQHPYTRGLLASVPRLDRPRAERLIPIEGQPPDLSRLDDGCSYRPRCGLAVDACGRERPELEPAGGGHAAACFRPGDVAAAA
ncbi:ABC transporter ATP-binding protein [Stella sp.]|uniref:ABC transporter ATP-binding protein n=1 Tax=Stella sp. TaxID=2912054 RepID=UPI0035B0BAA1